VDTRLYQLAFDDQTWQLIDVAAQPAHAADRCAREITAILTVLAGRLRRLMGNPLGRLSPALSGSGILITIEQTIQPSTTMMTSSFRLHLPRLSIILALVWGIPLLCLALLPVLARAQIDVHGRVIQRTVECPDPSNSLRCNTIYLLESQHSRVPYRSGAGYADSSILQNLNLPPGTVIDKDRWQLTYAVNGRVIDDFAVGMHILMTSLSLLLIGFALWRARTDGVFPQRTITAG